MRFALLSECQVHYGAQREALLSHFTRCGPVAKVVMLTDTITAQPKGYIYFFQKI